MPRKKYLTSNQAFAFDVILDGVQRGRPYSLREMMDIMGYDHSNSIRMIIGALRARGLIQTLPGKRGTVPAHPHREFGVVTNRDGTVEIYRAAPNFLELAESAQILLQKP